jgi:hypothetical protein
MFKEHVSTVSGAYVASQSVWSNGFPVYFQVLRPNQKDQFVVEFNMRPSTALDSLSAKHAVGVWELKSKAKIGSSECLFNFNTECDNPLLTLPPVTLKGAIVSRATACLQRLTFFFLGDESLWRLSRIELAGISSTLCNASARCCPDFTDAYAAFRVSQNICNSVPDTSAQREIASKPKQKSSLRTSSRALSNSGTTNTITKESCISCVWLDSKSGTETFSSIAVSISPPMSICVENCQGQNAIFVNGVYAFRNAYYSEQHLLLVYQSGSFGTILGCLVRNNRVSCAISSAAVKVFLQSKNQSSLQPFAFPRDWNLLQTVSPPAARVPPTPPSRAGLPVYAAGFGFGGGDYVDDRPPSPPYRPLGWGQLGVPALPFPAARVGDAASSAAQDASSTAAMDQKELGINCSEMVIRAAESSPDHNTPVHVWPSLLVVADVLKKCSFENKKNMLSHIWRHLVHRCGSDAAALPDLDLIVHLSSETSVALIQIQELSEYLSKTLDKALSDYVNAISDLADDWSSVPISIPASVASFLRTHNNHSMNSHLRKMYHSIFSVLSSRSADSLTSESSSRGRTSFELYMEVARVVGEPFGLCASDALLVVDPFSISSSSIAQSVACKWDTSFCLGNHQDGWNSQNGSNFTFVGSTVRFPSGGPIHCPTLEKFGDGLTEKGYLNFQYDHTDAWSVGLVPVSSLRDSHYLWSSASVIGYHFGESGTRLRRCPMNLRNHFGPKKVFVGVDSKNRTCSFYINGSLISIDSVPQNMFPCVIAISGTHYRRYVEAVFCFSSYDIDSILLFLI